MINLKNIKINKDFIEADASLVGTENECHVTIDAPTGNILSPERDKYFYGINHAFKELRKMARCNSKATERLVEWY